MPLDAQRCEDALPDREATLEALQSPGLLVSLAIVAVTVAGFVGGTEANASRMAAVAMAAVVAVLAGPAVSDRADR